MNTNESRPVAATELSVAGMTCNNCARHVIEAIQSVPGVRSASVMLEAQRASVRWSADLPADVPAVLEAIKRAGYAASPIAAAQDHDGHRHGNWHFNLWLGGVVTVALMLGEWVFDLGMARGFQWLAFVLAGAVQIFAGAQFYRGAWRQLKIGSANMDTLVALGSTTAFGYSVWALLSSAVGHVYFMEAAAIITLISAGHWIEARVSERASSSLKSLMQLAPATARRLVKEIQPRNFLNLRQSAAAVTEAEVPVASLQPDDLVALRPGDSVPVDGMVTEGSSAVNEAMLTGESLPVEKTVGAQVFAGTANLNGRLVMRVTATGEATALAHIIAAVQRAQTSRAHIQRLGDRVSNVFVPVVVSIALAAGLWWSFAPESAMRVHAWLGQFLWAAHPPAGAAAGFVIAAAVLIIACPCAMGLATPAAIMAGTNAAARRGILIRDGVALEKAGKITVIILDKTGTLTSGELAVSGPWTPNDSKEAVQQAQMLAGAMAQPSSHPVSKVIAWFASDKVTLENWKEISGLGVQANLHSEHGSTEVVRLGSLSWLQTCGISIPEGEAVSEKWKADGATLVGLSKDSSLIGVFALRDFLKANARRVVWQLQQQGLKTFLLTGDNPLTAAAIAKQAGIAPENVFAEVRPEQKAEFVRHLQAAGERVAFVGDGINDAPALTQADLGIAVSRASDVAREAADIILLRSDIEAVPEALGLARATLRTIKQNLFWAFFYNALGVPLAALGFMSPVLCAAAMGFSDLIVIGNALRLAKWRQPRRLSQWLVYLCVLAVGVIAVYLAFVRPQMTRSRFARDVDYYERARQRSIEEQREKSSRLGHGNKLVEIIFVTDDKPIYGLTNMGYPVSIYFITKDTVGSWWVGARGARGGDSPDTNAEEKARRCVRLLRSLDQPKELPKATNHIITVRCVDSGKTIERNFPISLVPSEIREMLTLIGCDEQGFKRLTFIQSMEQRPQGQSRDVPGAP